MTIFSPIDIGGRTFKNRTVMAPMVVNSCNPDGSVSQEFQDFYLARALGGVGFIVLGGVFVHPEGRGFKGQLGIDRDDLIPNLTGFADSIREHCRLAAQLSFKTIGRPPESLSLDQIVEYRKAFTAGALRARQCGFDAVELHACHDYWLNFFLSPYFNHRTDEYGGSLENRFRLLRETVEEIRQAVGRDLVLGVRLSLTDFMDGGLGLDESLQVGQWLDELGVDYLSASVGIGVTQFRMSPPCEVPRSSQIPLARSLQQTVSVPVIGVGRLDRPAEFRGAVEGGHVAMAAAARALIADPDYVSKIESGRDDDIRPCVACNFCLTRLKNGEKVRCAVNPYVGRDLVKPAPIGRPLNVTVIGAGPAGIMAASVAAGRGATVTLIEKRDRPGGALNVAKVPPFKEPLCDLSNYLVRQAKQSGATLRLNTEATADSVVQTEPDRVVVAAGAKPAIPRLTCLDETCVITAEELLRHKDIPAGDYLVMGGGLVGLETAEYISHRGGTVTVVEMLDRMGQGLGPMRRELILDRLVKAGVNLLVKTRVLSIDDRLVEVEIAGTPVSLGPFRTVVMAVGYTGDKTLFEELKDRVPADVIGDAGRVASIYEAVNQGLDWALAL